MKADQQKKLIEEAKAGERTAFDLLTRSCAEKIYNYALRLTRGNSASAEDITQEAFIKAYENIGKFEEKASFASWVFRIAANVWKNRVRYEKRRKFFSHFSIFGEKEDDQGFDIPDESSGPDKALENKIQSEEIQKALDKMPEQSKQMILLREVEELSYEEIAKAMNISMGTVKSRIARAREYLRGALNDES